MKILVLDNYDSFTYNLVQYLQEVSDHPIDVFRNDAISLEAVDAYDLIVLSPGPGVPEQAGIMPELLQRYASTKSIFGVCLGLQAIGEAFGGKLQNLEQVYHGLETPIQQTVISDPNFQDLPASFTVGRYHSWVVQRDALPEELQITAEDENGEIMALRHRDYNVSGVQFHPESIMTNYGKEILLNVLQYTAELMQKQPLRAPLK